MQADRLTPPMLRDLAAIADDAYVVIGRSGNTETRSHPIAPLATALREEAARREAEWKPQSAATGHYENDCEELGRAPAQSGDHPQGEREGPDSAAAPKGIVPDHDGIGCVRGRSEDKPAPADDLLMSNVDAFLCLPTAEKSVFEADNLLSRSRDRIEALTARVRELEAETKLNGELVDSAQEHARNARVKYLAEKARADGLAAAIDRAVEELDAIEKAASANDPWDELQVRAADTSKKLRMAAALTEGGA